MMQKTSNETLQLDGCFRDMELCSGSGCEQCKPCTLSSLGTKASGTHVIDLMSDTEFIENHYKIVSNKNRVYVRVAATVTAESKPYVNYSRVVEVIVNDIR